MKQRSVEPFLGKERFSLKKNDTSNLSKNRCNEICFALLSTFLQLDQTNNICVRYAVLILYA